MEKYEHHFLWEENNFPRVKLKENCGFDYALEGIIKIFSSSPS